jgi:hypothetical protein
MKRARRNFLAVLGGLAAMLPMTKLPTPANVYENLKGCWGWYETEDLLNGTPVRNKNVLLRKDGSFSVLSDAGGDVMQLNETAARIWELCDGRNSPEAMAKAISGDYDVSPGVCFKDVVIALRTFKRQGLIIC